MNLLPLTYFFGNSKKNRILTIEHNNLYLLTYTHLKIKYIILCSYVGRYKELKRSKTKNIKRLAHQIQDYNKKLICIKISSIIV